jgi:Tfp pilus assembly protein PilF
MTILLLLISSAFHAFAQDVPRQTFDILGTVRDNTGRPVETVRVTLLDENYGSVNIQLTSSSGQFQFRGVPRGRIYLRVDPVGRPYEEKTVSEELVSVRPFRGGTEPWPVDIILKRKDAVPIPERAGVVFAQSVPDAAKAEYDRGVNSLRDNKADNAIEALKRAVESFPDYFLALELLGTEYVKRNQFEPAIPVLTHAIQVNNAAAKSSYWLGVAHLKLNHLSEAIEALRKASDMEPSNANTFMMLGLAHGNNGELDASEAALKKAYQLAGPMVADAHLYLAGLYNKREKYGLAVRELELYLKEAKDLKDPTQIKAMIDKLKAKDKTKKS